MPTAKIARVRPRGIDRCEESAGDGDGNWSEEVRGRSSIARNNEHDGNEDQTHARKLLMEIDGRLALICYTSHRYNIEEKLRRGAENK